MQSGTTEFFINAVKETMDFRKANNVERNDFMQLLIELKEKGKILDVDKDEREPEAPATEGVHTTYYSSIYRYRRRRTYDRMSLDDEVLV